MAKSAQGCLLHLERDSWRIVACDGTDVSGHQFAPNDLLEQPNFIVETLAGLGLVGQPVVLGLSSAWCLAVTVPVASPQMLRKRTAMRYSLEEWIPWSAEDFVVDYIGHQSSACMVAVRIEPLRSFLRALEELDVTIAVVCPTAILAVSDLLSSAAKLPPNITLAWHHEQHIEVFTINNGRLYRWSRCECSGESIARELDVQAQASDNALPLVLLDVEPELAEDLQRRGLQIEGQRDDNLLETADCIAKSVSIGHQEALLDLKRDELAGIQSIKRFAKQFARLQFAAALILILITAGFWLRGNLYQEAIVDVEAALAEVHMKLFPNKEVPQDVHTSVNREFRQLQGTHTVSSDLPTRVDASAILQNLLSTLPKDLRFRLPEIQIEEGRISLGGEVRSNADADKIAAALRQGGFMVESPKTQRLAEQGFSVRLSAKPINASPGKVNK
jgi:hypothetical protein